MGIATHTKGLIGWLRDSTAALVRKPKNIPRLAHEAGPTVVKEVSEKAQESKKGFFSMRHKLASLFRRPLNDISHISIMIVVSVALVSGISTFSTGKQQQLAVNPFSPTSQTDQQYVSADEQRLLEADLVTTIASIHSDKLQNDASAVTEDLYKNENNLSGVVTALGNPTALSPSATSGGGGTITKYVVQNGDTLSQIADKFKISTGTVRYANNIDDADSIKPGSTLTILPVSGILYTTKDGDTIASVASAYNIKEDDIIGVNYLYGDELTPGMQIVLPDAEIPEAPKPAPAPAATTSSSDDESAGISYVKTSTGPNHFPWGWCTWWVAQKRYVPWSGNAWEWYGNAQAYGRPVGSTPVPGAIMVTWESGYGHVAYVESASGNSFTVSEMNYKGFGIVSTRSLTTSSVPLIGFIY